MRASMAARLRELLAQPGIVRVVGAHDALGAKLAEKAGFDGVWSSGLEISASHAVPDANILGLIEFLHAAQSMAEAVSVPVIADCDTGFGNAHNVIHMVRRFEAAGVAGVCIEDKQFPKVNSFMPDRQELAPLQEFAAKIVAAKGAQQSRDLVVIARVEALIAGRSLSEALRRARAYVDAGADAILIHAKSASPKPIADFAGQWDSRAPLVVVPTTYFAITARELEALGAKVVIYANHGLRASIRAMLDAYRRILESGSTASIEQAIAPLALVFELQGMPQFQRDEEAYLRQAYSRVSAGSDGARPVEA